MSTTVAVNKRCCATRWQQLPCSTRWRRRSFITPIAARKTEQQTTNDNRKLKLPELFNRQKRDASPKRDQTSKQSSQLQTRTATNSTAEGSEQWGVFDWRAYTVGWDVPWGVGTTVGGMLLWLLCFAGAGFLAVPLTFKAFGWQSFQDLGVQDRALLTLIDQTASSAAGLFAIWLVTRSFKDQLPDDYLRYDIRNPFRRPDGWLAWGLLGLALAPAVIIASGLLSSSVGYDAVGGRGTVDGVAQMIDVQPVTFTYLLIVTGVQAPIVEETVFRGFLLTSLSRLLPTPAAVAISAVCFGAAHLSARDFPQLVALGIVLGFVYVRSRNLLSCILVHGSWNSTVLLLLFALASSGVDIQQFLELANR